MTHDKKNFCLDKSTVDDKSLYIIYCKEHRAAEHTEVVGGAAVYNA